MITTLRCSGTTSGIGDSRSLFEWQSYPLMIAMLRRHREGIITNINSNPGIDPLRLPPDPPYEAPACDIGQERRREQPPKPSWTAQVMSVNARQREGIGIRLDHSRS